MEDNTVALSNERKTLFQERAAILCKPFAAIRKSCLKRLAEIDARNGEINLELLKLIQADFRSLEYNIGDINSTLDINAEKHKFELETTDHELAKLKEAIQARDKMIEDQRSQIEQMNADLDAFSKALQDFSPALQAASDLSPVLIEGLENLKSLQSQINDLRPQVIQGYLSIDPDHGSAELQAPVTTSTEGSATYDAISLQLMPQSPEELVAEDAPIRPKRSKKKKKDA